MADVTLVSGKIHKDWLYFIGFGLMKLFLYASTETLLFPEQNNKKF